MRFLIPLILSASSLFTSTAMARSFVVRNNCEFTIWPALNKIFTDLNAGSATPNQPTGWEAGPRSSVSFTVPDNWTSGRIWGRRNCDFTTNPGPNSCADGGCNGGLLCDQHTGTGVPPATLAQFSLSNVPSVEDFYDVSVVDGFNLPVRIDPDDLDCEVAMCDVDLVPNCPAPLIGPYNSTGSPVGCKSACEAGLSPDPSNSSNCCTGSYNTPQTCPSSGVQYFSYFKSNCPSAFAYAYDGALFSCPSISKADYVITFCP